jgi:hypothetical protein
MDLVGSIFLDFRLPNATSWFYISLLVSVGLFFRFARPFSLRNWDLLSLFALVPPLLFLSEARENRLQAERARQQQSLAYAGRLLLAAGGWQLHGGDAASGAAQLAACRRDLLEEAQNASRIAERAVWRSYLGLLVLSALVMARCLLDVLLSRRPAFVPNLSPAGLAFLGIMLLMVLGVKGMLPPAEPVPDGKTTSIVLSRATEAAAEAAEKVGRDSPYDSGLIMRRGMAIACHIIVVIGLVCIGMQQFQSLHAGIGAAVLYLMLPYTARFVQELDHALPAALIVLAFVMHRVPILAGLLLGLATGTVYFPAALFPAWFAYYRGKGARRFTLAFLAVLVLILGYFFLSPVLRPEMESALVLPDWKAWDLYAKPTSEGIWMGLDLHAAYRVPLLVGYLALVVASAFWPSPKNLAHLYAVSAALIVGVQFIYADAGGIYVLWYLPLLLLVILRPGVTTLTASPANGDESLLKRMLARLSQRLNRPLRQAQGS